MTGRRTDLPCSICRFNILTPATGWWELRCQHCAHGEAKLMPYAPAGLKRVERSEVSEATRWPLFPEYRRTHGMIGLRAVGRRRGGRELWK